MYCVQIIELTIWETSTKKNHIHYQLITTKNYIRRHFSKNVFHNYERKKYQVFFNTFFIRDKLKNFSRTSYSIVV